jgi:RNA polymerase sigma-70 factor (ECF subfamily)
VEDNSLIKKCQRGDKEAFQLLISKYHPFVYKFLLRIADNGQTAEDLTQETFIKVIRNIDKFDTAGKAKFLTYVISIAKNSFIDYLRREKRYGTNIPITEIEDVNIVVEDTVIDKLYEQSILANLEALSEEQKIAIKLKYIEGLTLKEIGDRLDLEPKTIKSRIHNGIVKLRKRLDRGDDNERD